MSYWTDRIQRPQLEVCMIGHVQKQHWRSLTIATHANPDRLDSSSPNGDAMNT